jgi:DNA polymerase-3 subunit delta
MIYLLYGPDEFARSEALAALRAALPPGLAELNLSVLDGRRLKLDALIGACDAFPIIAERRLRISTSAARCSATCRRPPASGSFCRKRAPSWSAGSASAPGCWM